MKSNTNSIIGVWGYGKVGQSLCSFWTDRGYTLYVMDKNKNIEQVLKKDFPAAVFFAEPEKPDFFLPFFIETSVIYPSPGVDIILYYQKIKAKVKTELDLFFTEWQKPTIAITGSVGKTTTVSFLSSLLHEYNISVTTGGNIGTPLLELLSSKADYAVIELSSFQLEHSKHFYPTIAVWTNFYPNHLDRHGTEENYFKAKYQMFIRQTPKEKAVVPTSIIPYFKKYGWPKSELYFVQDEEIYSKTIKGTYPLFMYDKNDIYCINQSNATFLFSLNNLPSITIAHNWLTLAALLYAMHMLDNTFVNHAQKLTPVPHRTEFVAIINTVTFINDSKSTTIASTLAAVEKYKHSYIILIIGGLSKGVDRLPLFTHISSQVKHVITFGAEAEQLHAMCIKGKINAFACKTLNEAVQKAVALAPQNGIVLFSPAGSSYDLFNNYEERGDAFKRLVSKYHF